MANKYQLETIPVWDGIKSQSECFICDLMQQAEKDSLEFFLGSSVMNPETRVRVNATGFCPEHTAKLVESGHPNSMAVMWETHLERTRDELQKVFKGLENGKNLKKTVANLDEVLGQREKGCLICQRMRDRLDRYCFTIPYIWGQDPEFRKALDGLAEKRKELAQTCNRLVAEMRAKIDAVRARLGEGAADAAIKAELEKDEAWNALFQKVKDVNTAFDDLRQKGIDATRSRMAPAAAKEISK